MDNVFDNLNTMVHPKICDEKQLFIGLIKKTHNILVAEIL